MKNTNKPCPFCGEKANGININHKKDCFLLLTKMTEVLPHTSELVEMWNTRPTEMPSNVELIDQIESMNSFISQLRINLFKMFDADAKAGCGFYNDGEWQNNYLKLQKMINCEYATCVYDPKDNSLPERILPEVNTKTPMPTVKPPKLESMQFVIDKLEKRLLAAAATFDMLEEHTHPSIECDAAAAACREVVTPREKMLNDLSTDEWIEPN